jgi:hypothetical protein
MDRMLDLEDCGDKGEVHSANRSGESNKNGQSVEIGCHSCCRSGGHLPTSAGTNGTMEFTLRSSKEKGCAWFVEVKTRSSAFIREQTEPQRGAMGLKDRGVAVTSTTSSKSVHHGKPRRPRWSDTTDYMIRNHLQQKQ